MSIVAAMAAVPCVAGAAEPGHGELFFVPSADLEVHVPHYGRFDDDGDGWGGKFFAPFGATGAFALTGEYQANDYDDSDVDLDQFRIGGGWQTGTDLLSGGIFAEYIDTSLDDDDSDGYGIHGRITGKAADAVRLYAQAGYVNLDTDDGDMDGPEFLVGISYDLTPRVGLYADYRHTELEGDQGVEYTLDDVRTGVSIKFAGLGGGFR